MKSVFAKAFADIGAALRNPGIWIALAREDIGDQHRRTTLGPIWLLINYLAFAGAFIAIFSGDPAVPNFAAYVATGLLVWLFMSETITLSASLFQREESLIKGTVLPLSTYVLRLTMQSFIRTSYATAGCVILLLLSQTPITPYWIVSALALLALFATAPAVILLVATLGTYFPDSQFIITNLMRLGMFLTPIFWAYSGGHSVRAILYYWNPFTYFVEIVRIPIVAADIPIRSITACLIMSAFFWILALYVLGRIRKKIAFQL